MGEQRPAVADIQQTVQPPPGWYDDGKGGKRWWDGTGWAEVRQPAEPTPEPQQISGVAVMGYAFAIFLPLIGFITGLALIAKGDRHAVGVTLVSLLFAVLWISLAV
jgi:hypothetical protein